MFDTHVLVWWFQGDDRLGRTTRGIIDTAIGQARAMIPAFCAWEIAHLERDGRVPFTGGAAEWMHNVVATPGVELAALTPEIAIDSVLLEWAHKDPADRLIVATARSLDFPLVTADRKILAYAAAGYVRAVDARV